MNKNSPLGPTPRESGSCCRAVDGGGEASTIARVRSGWKIFRVLLPLLASQECYSLW